MYLKKIKIQNFRNYKFQEINFDKGINIFFGDNAQGKTNILEAVFLCAFGKSFRTNKEKEMIKKNENFAGIDLDFEKKDRGGNIKFKISDKKYAFVNGVKLNKLSELLGNINLVIFTPDDINILKDGPDERRRFLDMMIGQLRPRYIYLLNMYLKNLKQRNNYLKEKTVKDEMLEIWDEQLAKYGEEVYKYRKEYIEKIKGKIYEIHSEIANEEIKIEYFTNCTNKKEYLKKLKDNKEIDKIRGFTSFGIHRDDFKVYINGEEIGIFGSQGQNRTAILSLKLAELKVIYEEIGEYPILLLDDFMSELDEKRISKFLLNINDIQVLVTCTKNIDIKNSKSFSVANGEVEDLLI